MTPIRQSAEPPWQRSATGPRTASYSIAPSRTSLIFCLYRAANPVSFIAAINVMPVGQLDGGRIVRAIYGRKVVRITTIATLIVLAVATLANPLALYWAIVTLFLQRDLERPSLEELTEPDDIRAALGLSLCIT